MKGKELGFMESALPLAYPIAQVLRARCSV